MKPPERLPKITKTHKITFEGRVISRNDLVKWLSDIPAEANITVIQAQSYDPREGGGYTTFSAEEVHHEQ